MTKLVLAITSVVQCTPSSIGEKDTARTVTTARPHIVIQMNHDRTTFPTAKASTATPGRLWLCGLKAMTSRVRSLTTGSS